MFEIKSNLITFGRKYSILSIISKLSNQARLWTCDGNIINISEATIGGMERLVTPFFEYPLFQGYTITNTDLHK